MLLELQLPRGDIWSEVSLVGTRIAVLAPGHHRQALVRQGQLQGENMGPGAPSRERAKIEGCDSMPVRGVEGMRSLAAVCANNTSYQGIKRQRRWYRGGGAAVDCVA